MSEEVFLQSQSQVSKRHAVLEDDGNTAFLYLTAPEILKPVRDAIVYCRVAPEEKVEWENAESGEPPSLHKAIASPEAVIENPNVEEFDLKWSLDGDAVAVLRNGQPLAFVAASDRIGYSKAVSISSPLVGAWSQARYISLFSA